MRPSKPPNSLKPIPHKSPPKINSKAQLFRFQRLMTAALFRPLTADSKMQKTWFDGRRTATVVSGFIKPNDRLTSFERLEIYNRQYWFRVLDSLYEDYPAVRAVLGDRAFLRLAEAFLTSHPSTSFTMRNLGRGLQRFLWRAPKFAGENQILALEVARFEWAQVTAFDNATLPPLALNKLGSVNPAKLRLGLQPHISLLRLRFPVDKFVLAVKKHQALRGEASNAVESRIKVATLRRVSLPEPRATYVAVHRYDNRLYYKRLEPEAFRILTALRRGMSLESACTTALRLAPPTVDWGVHLKEWFESWSSLGWFCVPGETARCNQG
jgi:hypothetical protein